MNLSTQYFNFGKMVKSLCKESLTSNMTEAIMIILIFKYEETFLLLFLMQNPLF